MIIQDFIHYYIGCKVENYDIYALELPTLKGVQGDRVILSEYKCRTEDCKDYTIAAGSHELAGFVKPILRRLEGMSYAEADGLAKLQHDESRHSQIDVLYIKKDHIHYIDGTMWQGDGVSELNEYFVYFNQLQANQFHYLLQQQFDLFGLIDAGLAVDVKTMG